jgi:hypothetical protein
VTDTIIAPQLPLRTRAFRNVPISAVSADALVGAVYRRAGGGGRRVADVREVFAPVPDRVFERVGALEPLAPALGGRTPPFWAAAVMTGAASPAVQANRSVIPSERRGKRMCVQITM